MCVSYPLICKADEKITAKTLYIMYLVYLGEKNENILVHYF